MNIAVGTDHAGFQYKEAIKQYLGEIGHDVQDFGTHSEEAVDYPLFVRPVAEAVSRGEFDRGIVLGGSGNGEAIAANRVSGVRCTLCWNLKTARLARKHNNANILSLGARTVSMEKALNIVKVWMETPFDGGRHVRRIELIDSDPGAPRDSKKADKIPDDKYDVLISLRYIIYSEGKDAMEFQVDPGLKHPTIIHIPSEERWKKESPEWARNRRDEILDRLKEKCIHLNYQIKEF